MKRPMEKKADERSTCLSLAVHESLTILRKLTCRIHNLSPCLSVQSIDDTEFQYRTRNLLRPSLFIVVNCIRVAMDATTKSNYDGVREDDLGMRLDSKDFSKQNRSTKA